MLFDQDLLPEDFTTLTDALRPEDDAHGTYWYSKLGKKLVQFGCSMCHVSFRQRFDPNDTSRDPLWSDLMYYFNYYFTLKAMVALYLQFVLDYRKYKLDKFDQIAARYAASTFAEQHVYRNQLVQDYEELRASCAFIGAPFTDLSYLLEIGILFLITLTNTNYLVPQFINFDVAIVWVVLAPHRLQASIDSLVSDRVNNFIVSARTYYTKAFEQDHRNDDKARYRHIKLYGASRGYMFHAEQVKSMAYNGVFQPYNRRKHRIREVAIVYDMIVIVLIINTLCLWLLFVFVLPQTYLHIASGTDPKERLFRAEILVSSLIGITTACTYVSSTIMMCVDQLYYVIKLCNLINECIIGNNCTLVAYLSHSCCIGAPPYVSIPVAGLPLAVQSRHEDRSDAGIGGAQVSDDVYDRINLNLLQTLLHYKIFVKQLRSHFTAFKLFTSLAISVIFLLPLITRILIAYLDKVQQSICVIASVIIVLIIDCSLVMICRLHERCLDIYRHLQSLMAHNIAMDSLLKVHTDRPAYDEHLTWALRSELDHPERLTDQFSTRLLVGQTNMTYASLLSFHFWWGILTLSVMIIDPSLPKARDVFGGIWRYYGSADADVARFFSNSTKLLMA